MSAQRLCVWPACKTSGCLDCDEAVDLDEPDYADEDEDHSPPEFGCCLPAGECCMPGLHFPSECHTTGDYERAHPLDTRGLHPLAGKGVE